MIKQLYSKIGRLAHFLLSPILKTWFNQNMVRVRALIITPNSEILLTRSWFGYQRWSLPGGGIARGEKPAEAASREVLEETGIYIKPSDFKHLGDFANGDSSAPFTINCQVARVEKQPVSASGLQKLEILDVDWVLADKLPLDHSSTVDKALKLI